MPGWKLEQKKRRQKNFFSLLKGIISLLLLLLVVFLSFSIVKTISKVQLNFHGRTTVVLNTIPVLLLSFEPKNKLIIISLPSNIYLQVPRGFGSYKLSSIWDLGDLEKSVGGGRLLKETIEEFIGIPVDGWLGWKIGNYHIGSQEEDIISSKNRLTSWKYLVKPKETLALFKNVQTNLNLLDLVWFWWQIKLTRFDKMNYIDLSHTEVLSKLTLADKSEVVTVNPLALDYFLKELFYDAKIINEHIGIEVLNGTDQAGLANRFSRLITNLGGNIITLGNSDQRIDQCLIIGEKKILESYTGQRFINIFNCKKIIQKPESRADLQIVVGDDYYRKLLAR